ncbi:helix-turn-helix domain-containing GNAT family N-acetyltransferase [Mesorhizobium sp. LHD-90]|uniref:bifunctional helix-turn-helix transcriptional regulator/GNAT family N-acetyltransferase n=1 Tax=Mesorhizobium sp. LHD-90 TaxID=3071414 RepID=UPI0027E02B94|nr:helix-turn-helix domain-containing GNAT family N-acetyltransferase [Mesorhizobium sp. LHD-90]MDQ6436671.1 helix-turn-helix domain-containing GNAT family N-acetyltransferase [Mesorhizobium sp. LHD-90]
MDRPENQSQIEKVRDASRRLVRELGFMKPTVGATGLPISAVHALIEIGARGTLTAAALGEVLNLEKSSVSRMLRKLVEQGEVEERENPDDARSKLLSLTPGGAKMLGRIDSFGRSQVSGAFGRLSAGKRDLVVGGLEAYAHALRAARLGGEDARPAPQVEIVAGYVPGVIGRVAEMHGRYYVKPYGLGRFFEAKVAAGMAEFSARLDRPVNGLWVAVQDGRVMGSVAIDGEDLGDGVGHLRWFVMDEALRGLGVGKLLLAEAVAFCDRQNFRHVDLWTLRGLDAARRLYEDFGFTLVEEFSGDQWGMQVTEQRFRRVPR